MSSEGGLDETGSPADLRKMKYVLVTGGAGFIGSHVVEELVARGCDVVVADNLSTGFVPNLSAVEGRFQFIDTDLLHDDLGNVLAARPFDTVIHAAGNSYIPPSIENPQKDLEDNILLTHKLLAALRARDSRAVLVNISSAAIYGQGSGTPMEENDAARPVSPYGISKLAAETYVALYARIYGLKTSTVRLFSTFGPRLRKQVVWDFMNRLSSDPSELVIHGDGTDLRDLNHIRNVVAAILLVAERSPMNGDVFNVAGKEVVSINDLAVDLAAEMGLSPSIRHSGNEKVGNARIWTANISRIEALGYRRVTSYDEGLTDTVAWFHSLSQPTR